MKIGQMNQKVKEQYAINFKEDKNQLNLNNWGKFEEENNNTFRSMYQFWVKKSKQVLNS